MKSDDIEVVVEIVEGNVTEHLKSLTARVERLENDAGVDRVGRAEAVHDAYWFFMLSATAIIQQAPEPFRRKLVEVMMAKYQRLQAAGKGLEASAMIQLAVDVEEYVDPAIKHPFLPKSSPA